MLRKRWPETNMHNNPSLMFFSGTMTFWGIKYFYVNWQAENWLQLKHWVVSDLNHTQALYNESCIVVHDKNVCILIRIQGIIQHMLKTTNTIEYIRWAIHKHNNWNKIQNLASKSPAKQWQVLSQEKKKVCIPFSKQKYKKQIK